MYLIILLFILNIFNIILIIIIIIIILFIIQIILKIYFKKKLILISIIIIYKINKCPLFNLNPPLKTIPKS